MRLGISRIIVKVIGWRYFYRRWQFTGDWQ